MKSPKLISIDKVVPNPENPRVIRDEQFNKLVKSIEDFPEMLEIRTIILDDKNVILGGNMRYEACKFLNMDKVPVLYAKDFSDEEKKRFIITDNVGFGDWDWDVLYGDPVWNVDDLNDYGLDVWNEQLFDEDDEQPQWEDQGDSGAFMVMCPECMHEFSVKKKEA